MFENLPGIDGKTYSLDDFYRYKALVIIFMCVHCPYVQKIEHQIVELHKKYADHQVRIVAINPNNVEQYPEDSLENMKKRAEAQGYSNLIYLRDNSQAVAKAYMAECTPDLYLFDQDRELVYHGRIEEMHQAIDLMLAGEDPIVDQMPSQGCSIKWRET